MWESEGDRTDGVPICMADEVADRMDDNTDDEATDAGLDESNGVDSDAGGSPELVLASRLQTGQNVLHAVSQESTHNAWNSAQCQIYQYQIPKT